MTETVKSLTGVVRILLADDHTVMRAGLRLLLERHDNFEVVGEAADGREAVEIAAAQKPDVVVMDVAMPHLNGVEAARQILSRNPDTAIVMLSMHSDESYVLRSLKAGARGYLLKDVSLEQLVEAVRTVAGGGSLVAPMVTQRLMAGVARMQNNFTSLEQPDPLTERETEILRLLSGGYSNKEIANSLKVAEGTVKNHVSNILSKLGVRDRTRAVLKALEMGIV
jgi:DNA-binding NarL/FixJ family response regulator